MAKASLRGVLLILYNRSPSTVHAVPAMIAFNHARFVRNIALVVALIGVLSACQSNKGVHEEAVKTALMSDTGVAVYAAGDIADCRNRKPEDSGAAKTAALIIPGLARDEHAAVLALGDNTYPVGLLGEFTNCYEPTWGQFKQRTFPAPGNHEYYTPNAVGYYSYFGAAAGPTRNGYYSTDIGSWHVISLNSYLKPEQHKAQMEWLKSDLEKNKARCTLAYWHHPLFSSGGHGNNAQMTEAWRMLQAAGADLVLSAHDHDYERFAPQDADGQQDDKRGMREFVVGTGGAKLTPLRFRRFHSEVSDNSSHGVLKLVLKNQGYEWEFLPVDKDGFTDRGAALCH
ncbi:metallophosphoesterase [Herbaspirillum sp. ST 5-3]|uniref:metallophosphoesterase family protein n=1 Tax=Oxalobacteraceae TaxID=75682 RepID=UPI0020004B62|nr:metallophosphoesterase [Herbaspirillum sp. ST 5-3]